MLSSNRSSRRFILASVKFSSRAFFRSRRSGRQRPGRRHGGFETGRHRRQWRRGSGGNAGADRRHSRVSASPTHHACRGGNRASESIRGPGDLRAEVTACHLYMISTGCDGAPRIASLADEMGISSITDLHGVRCSSISSACTVRARRSVPVAANAHSIGAKSCPGRSKPSKCDRDGGFLNGRGSTKTVPALNLEPSMAMLATLSKSSSRHSATKVRQTSRMALPLSLRKSAMVLKSGANCPVSQTSSMLCWHSRSSRWLDGMRLR